MKKDIHPDYHDITLVLFNKRFGGLGIKKS